MALIVPLADRVKKLQALTGENLAEPAREVPAAVREAADQALQRGETHYTDRPGILPLREQVAAQLAARFNITADAAGGVVITCGVTEARFVAVQQMLPVGGTLVALSHPERVAAACTIRGASLFGPDELVQDSQDGKATVLYLTSETPEVVRSDWLKRAGEEGWPVIFEVSGASEYHPAASGVTDQTITIGGIGLEEGMESWRLGYLAAPLKTTGPLRDFKQALTICTTNVSQWGALALEEGTQ